MTDRESYEPSPFSSFGEDEESENASDLQAEHPRVGPHDSVADDGFMPHPDRPAFKYERIDLDDNIFENEPIYCCDGRISLNHVSVAINIFVIVCIVIILKCSTERESVCLCYSGMNDCSDLYLYLMPLILIVLL